MSWRAAVRTRVGSFDLDVSLEGSDGPLALVGPNGSGKTTLLRVLAGALDPDEAEVEVSGRVLLSTARGVKVPIDARGVGYVPQRFRLFPHLSALDNVAFGLSTGPRRLPRAERHARAQRLLEELGCGDLAGRGPRKLSGGERQRVALARAIAVDPSLLLLDEPMAALDASARRSVRRFLSEWLRGASRPTVLVTHDVRDVAALDAPVCVIEGGRVVQRGRLAELRAAPATEFVAELVS